MQEKDQVVWEGSLGRTYLNGVVRGGPTEEAINI